MRHVLECVDELVATNNRLNRRCQESESAARTKVEEVLRAGPSLGRALSAWAAGDYRRRLEEAEKKIIPEELRKTALEALKSICVAAPPQTLGICTQDTHGFEACPCIRCRCDVVRAILLGHVLPKGI
jgi:protein required for attachment to host cells